VHVRACVQVSANMPLVANHPKLTALTAASLGTAGLYFYMRCVCVRVCVCARVQVWVWVRVQAVCMLMCVCIYVCV
jgi:hypothetical protein